ncbi:cyclic pyranopterin monophosphate synthase MoaC [Hippea sp. KM1]|uniref:cyclic pyranopterin monophosphate synthase MoaC n=1 Tax=Hippea sp. KM1 TaxID=944481 RepID=UPI00046CD5FB|nr:cyclic pyranopterin monophosphate synthase MoaC [Hippea sp. KM1]
MDFTHFNAQKRARMVDVSHKDYTLRIAKAYGEVKLSKEAYLAVKEGKIKKGDVLAVAQVGGIMGAKQTPYLIPMCHPLTIEGVDISFEMDDKNCTIKIFSEVKITHKTGVEMEALTAVSIAALTIYDMCKAIDRSIQIKNIQLLYKEGGKSGVFDRTGSKK